MLEGKTAERRELVATVRGSQKSLSAWTVSFATADLLTFLKAYQWYEPRSKEARLGNPLALQIEFLEGKAGETGIRDWLLLGPGLSKARGKKLLLGVEFDVVFRSRHENQEARFHTYNDPVHRAFARHITEQDELPGANSTLNGLRGKRGVMIYYPITET